MTKELHIQNTKIRYLFYLLMSGILVWFLILQAFGTNERDINEVSDMLVYHPLWIFFFVVYLSLFSP